MNVFVPFDSDTHVELLTHTLEAWNECDGADPVAVQVDNQMKFRIAADNLSDGKFYILAELGCIPSKNDLVRLASKKLSDEHGMVGLRCVDSGTSEVPKGVVFCQKGVISHWIPRKSADYSQEHMDSMLRSGKKVQIWGDLTYKHVGAS